jgi:protein CpxP
MRHLSLTLSAVVCAALSGSMLMAQSTPPPPPQDAAPQSAAQAGPQNGQQDGQQYGNGRMHHHHAPNPQHQAKWMAKKLGLSADQQSQLEPVLADRDQQTQSLRTDSSLAPRDRHAKMEALRADTQQKINGILTPAQQQQFAQMQTQMEERHHERHGGPDGSNGAPGGEQAPPPGN